MSTTTAELLVIGNEILSGRPIWRPWPSASNYFGRIHVVPWPLVTIRPEVMNVVQANFGSAIQLYGFDLSEPTERNLELTLHWQAMAVPNENYFTFIHLVSTETGQIVSQTGFVPVEGLRDGTALSIIGDDRHRVRSTGRSVGRDRARDDA